MKKSVLSKIRKKISTEIIKQAATKFDKTPDAIYKVLRGDIQNLDILDYLISEAKKEQDAFENRKKEIEEKAAAL